MMIMELEIREKLIYCELKENDSHVTIADLQADQMGDVWFVSSSNHPDSEALNEFEATDQWIATPLLIGIGRRLNQRILAGDEE